MKHLRLYENKNSEDKVFKVMNEYDEMCNIIKDFINFD